MNLWDMLWGRNQTQTQNPIIETSKNGLYQDMARALEASVSIKKDDVPPLPINGDLKLPNLPDFLK